MVGCRIDMWGTLTLTLDSLKYLTIYAQGTVIPAKSYLIWARIGLPN